MKVLFVCTGNTCRSPMAEGIFRDKVLQDGLEGKIFSQSAGLSAVDKIPAAENAILTCREIGIDISGHTARRIAPEDTEAWDLYFPMSKTHAYILEQAGVAHTKIYIPKYIDDPYGQGLEVYRKCREKLEIELRLFYNNVVKRLITFEA